MANFAGNGELKIMTLNRLMKENDFGKFIFH